MEEKQVRSATYRFSLCGIFFLACTLSACASHETPSTRKWLADGSIQIMQPVPPAGVLPDAELMGFAPHSALYEGSWLSVDLKRKVIALMDGGKQVSTASGAGIAGLKPGRYQLLHKQRNALWYAPDSYFTARNIAVPPEGDKDRYRRGALGEFALFITRDAPIHSGPVWTPEIGGVQIRDNDISRIYYLLPIGAPIEIR